MFHKLNGFRTIVVTNAVLSTENMKYAKQIQLLFFFIVSPLNSCNMFDSLKEHSTENNSSYIRETASLNSSSKINQRTYQNERTNIPSNASQAYLDSDLFRLIVNDLGNFDTLDEKIGENTTSKETHTEDLETESTQKDLHEGESQTKGIWKLPPEFVASLNLNSVLPSLRISPPNNQSNVTHGKVDTQRDESRLESAWLPGILSQHSLHPVSVIESRSFVTNPEISSLRFHYILAKPEKVVENQHRRQYSSAEDDSVETTEDFAPFIDDDYRHQLEKEAEAMIKRKNAQDKKQDTSSAEEKKHVQTTPVETEHRKSQPNPMFKNHVFFFKGDEDMFKDFFGFGGHSGPKLHSEFYQGGTSSETLPPSGQEILNHDDHHEENFDGERGPEEFHGHHYPETNAPGSHRGKPGSSLCEQRYKTLEETPGSYEEHSYEEAPEQPPPQYTENINEPAPYYENHLNTPVDFQSEGPASHYHQGHPENIQHQSQEIPHHQESGETSNNYHDGSVEQTPGYQQETNEPGYINEPTYHKDSGAPNTDYPSEVEDSSNSYEDNPHHRPSKEYSNEGNNYSKESQNAPEQNYDSKEYDGGHSPCQEEERVNPQADKVTTPAVRHQYEEVNHHYRESHIIKGESNFQQNNNKQPEIRTVSSPHAFPMQKENIPNPIYRDGPLRNIRLEGGFKPVLRTTVNPDCDDVDPPNSLDHWRHPPVGPDAQNDISPTSGEHWTARNPVILPIIRLRHPILTPPPQTFGGQRRERSPSEVLTPQASSEQKSAEKVPEKKKSPKKQSKSRKFKKSRRRRHPKKPKKKKRSKRDHMKAEESSYHWGLEKHKDMDGFFMYANIPGSENYEYGYRVGGPEHNLERHHKTGGRRSTIKLNWEDENGDSGDQYWEFNHDDVEESGDIRSQKQIKNSKQ